MNRELNWGGDEGRREGTEGFSGEDEALRAYLASRLNGQLGRCQASFEHFSRRSQSTLRQRRWRAMAALASGAASVLLLAWLTTRRGDVVEHGPRLNEAGEQAATRQMKAGPDMAEDTSAVATGSGESWRDAIPAQEQQQRGSGKGVAAGPRTTPLPAEPRSSPSITQQRIRYRSLDLGVVMIDANTPARKLRRQWLERVEWFDVERQARMETIVPREEVVLVPLVVQ